MPTLFAGYSVRSTLFQSATTIVYRAHRVTDLRPVIIKTPNPDNPRSDTRADYQREFAILQRLANPGVIAAIELHTHTDPNYLVLEDFGGISLAAVTRSRRLTIPEVLSIGVRLAEILETIHTQGFIHHDLNPTNILLNPDTDELKLADFGACTPTSRPGDQTTPVQSTVAYMSPEQTGRTNRPIDYRTDFYSLGITLYELLAARLPFESEDVHRLVHSHVARHPPPIREYNPDVPGPLAALIARLLAKDPDARYQSAWGLEHDLRQCADRYQRTPSLAGLRIGLRDISDRLRLPRRLYGRERAHQQLMAGFARVARGGRELLIVSGVAGIGKSSLLRDLREPVARAGGYFIEGRCDRHAQEVPYAAIGSALASLTRIILGESDQVLASWRNEMQAALGDHGQVLIDIAPELELLLGPQPDVPDLESRETRRRLERAFQSLADVLCSARHPLVMLFDDVQWGDRASMSWVSSMLTHSHMQHLLIIASYRQSQIDENHPLTTILSEIRARNVPVGTIALEPLAIQDVSQMLGEALGRDPSECRELGGLIVAKTHGNPLFIERFLHQLRREQHLYFDVQRHRWDWSLAAVANADSTDNVVDYLIKQVRALPEAVSGLLQRAACIGTHFDSDTLASLSGSSPEEVQRALEPAIDMDLLKPIADVATGASYRFLHERVQKAAYEIMPEAHRCEAHLHIARLWHDGLGPPGGQRADDDRILAVFQHFQRGAHAIETDEERLLIARLGLSAGRHALDSLAFSTAADILSSAIALLGARSWHEHYQLRRDLSLAALEAEHLRNNRIGADALAQDIIDNARGQLDRFAIHQFQIMSHIACNRMRQAIDLAREVLREGGVSLPLDPESAAEYESSLVARLLDSRLALDAADDQRTLEDPHVEATLRILCSACSAAIISDPQALPAMVLSALALCVDHGPSELSPMVYAWQAVISCGNLDDIPRGIEFGNTARRLLERFPSPRIASRTQVTLYAFVVHWQRPLAETLDDFPGIIRRGLDSGEFEYACFAAIDFLSALMFAGRPLAQVRAQQAHYFELIERSDMAFQLVFTQAWMQITESFITPSSWLHERRDRSAELTRLAETSNLELHALHLMGEMMLAYYFGAYEYGLELIRHRQISRAIAPGTLNTVQHNTFDSLLALAALPLVGPSERSQLLARVDANQSRMRRFGEIASMNFGHRYAFVEAERARASGDSLVAMERFQEALSKARAQGNQADEALIRERSAALYDQLGQEEIARMYLVTSHRCYEQWGALAKCAQLESRDPWLSRRGQSRSRAPTTGDVIIAVPSSANQLEALDTASIIKASQAISGELDLDRLLTSLLEIIIENVGAQRGYLLLAEAEGLTVEAKGDAESQRYWRIPSTPVAQLRQRMSLAMVNYVTRTKSSLMLGDASESAFVSDPYIASHRPRSLLCAPILSAGELQGIIYLENNLTPQAFTNERLKVVQVLASQAAISLRNARLMNDLGRTIDELRAAKAAIEQASRAKSEFFASVNHELRTPLNGVVGMLELLSGFSYQETQQDYLDTASASARQLMRVIDDTLDLARIEVGRVTLHPVAFRLGACVEEIARIVSPMLQERQLHFTHDIVDGVPDRIVGDEARLRQVLINLLNNALKFTDPGGCVALRVTTESATANRVVLSFEVRDSGIGIPKEAQEGIFEPFFQPLHAEAEPRQGSGLGLAIVAKLVALMGGHISAQSEPGQGSCFSFTAHFDLWSPTALTPDATELADDPTVLSGLRILLAEDNPVNQKVATRLLERDGHSVTVAHNGAEAVARWAASRFDVILMDGQMPTMDGFAATREIRRREAGGAERVPIVAVTAYAMPDDLERCRAAGMDAYVSKPIALPRLRAALNSVLDPDRATATSAG